MTQGRATYTMQFSHYAAGSYSRSRKKLTESPQQAEGD